MFNLTIVSMFKNEAMILEEWITYYIRQGIEHFYLIDNGSSDNYNKKIDKYWNKITLVKDSFRVKNNQINKLKSFDKKKNRYVINDSSTHTQVLLVNNYFLEKVKNESKWTMYIDCDEYIYIPKSKNINDFLINLDKNKKYDEITDIFIPWKIFGSNNLVRQPNSIINEFNKRMNNDNFKNRVLKHGNVRGHGKSITKTKYLTLLGIHKCNLFIPLKTLMPDYSIIGNSNIRNFMRNFNYNKCFIFCNHYMVMSKEYFLIYKIKRDSGCGCGKNNQINDNYWEKNNKNETIDNTLIYYLNKLQK